MSARQSSTCETAPNRSQFDVCITVDVEQDCPPFMSTFRGINEGLPRLVAMLDEENVTATFFTTGEVARKFPHAIRDIVNRGHEIGCHGDTHRRFDMLDDAAAQAEIAAATTTLRAFDEVVSFRAPNLRLPEHYVRYLEAADYRLDSSQAKYKRGWGLGRPQPSTLARVPASITSSWLRLPWFVRRHIFKRLVSPAVLFVHPWEFVDLRRSQLRWDCRFRTGDMALECLRECVRFFRVRGARFVRMKDLLVAPAQATKRSVGGADVTSCVSKS